MVRKRFKKAKKNVVGKLYFQIGTVLAQLKTVPNQCQLFICVDN